MSAAEKELRREERAKEKADIEFEEICAMIAEWNVAAQIINDTPGTTYWDTKEAAAISKSLQKAAEGWANAKTHRAFLNKMSGRIFGMKCYWWEMYPKQCPQTWDPSA